MLSFCNCSPHQERHTSKPHFLPADFCLTSTTPAYILLDCVRRQSLHSGHTDASAAIPAPRHTNRCATSRCRLLSSWALHLQGDRMGARMSRPRGFPPAMHTGAANSVLQSSTGSLAKLRRVLCCTRAAVCWPVKPASPVQRVVEQETGREARPDSAPQSFIPLSPTHLAMLTSCGEMCLYSQCSFWRRKDIVGQRKTWDRESFRA